MRASGLPSHRDRTSLLYGYQGLLQVYAHHQRYVGSDSVNTHPSEAGFYLYAIAQSPIGKTARLNATAFHSTPD